MRMYFIAHKKILYYAELNPGLLEQIFTKQTFFLLASWPLPEKNNIKFELYSYRNRKYKSRMSMLQERVIQIFNRQF